MDHNLVEIMFLFGLDEAEFTQLFAQFNIQSLEKLCAKFKDQKTCSQSRLEEDKIMGVKEDLLPSLELAPPSPLCDTSYESLPLVTPRRSKRSSKATGDDDETVEYFQNGRPKREPCEGLGTHHERGSHGPSD